NPRKPAAAAFAEAIYPVSLSDPVILTALLTMLATIGAVVALRWLDRRAAMACIAAIIAADLFVARPMFPLQPIDSGESASVQRLRELHAGLPAELRDQPARIDVSSRYAASDAAMGAGVENANGYWPLALGRYYRYVHAVRGVTVDAKRHDRLNERVYDGEPADMPILNVAGSSRFGRDGEHQWQPAARVLPRAWWVSSGEQVEDESAALARVRSPGFDPAKVVLLENPELYGNISGAVRQPTTTQADSDVNVQTLPGGGLDIRTWTAADGFLVISEVFYPGWKATMDGQPVAVERADSVIAAIRLRAGRHEIAYRFDPLSVKLGLLLTGVSWLTGVGTMLGSRLRRRRTIVTVPDSA
ncbi:MAG: YfhO family protein, partial [Phycisphaerae bacterium]|nr:YfhO family protein [Phycisphaerae bacterium]